MFNTVQNASKEESTSSASSGFYNGHPYSQDAQSNIQSNTQSNTQLNTLDPTLDPTPDPALIPDKSQRQTIPVGRKASLAWTDLMEETLFNELHKQDRLGKRADIGFKSNAWTVVRDAV
jgi:hypothetical protein